MSLAWNAGLAKVEGSGRKAGTPNRKTLASKEATKDFFKRVIDDEVEAKFWRYFITGYESITLPDGNLQLITIPLNAVSFAAFKRAIEYKRGMPIQLVEHSNQDGAAFKIEVEFCQPQR